MGEDGSVWVQGQDWDGEQSRVWMGKRERNDGVSITSCSSREWIVDGAGRLDGRMEIGSREGRKKV